MNIISRFAAATVLAFAAIASPASSDVAQAATVPANTTGAILFEDDFNGTAGALPDQSKWGDFSTATYNSTAAFGAIKPGDNETLDGSGNLVIPAVPGAGSAIRSDEGFTYGTFSAWIKNPTQQGYWPAFWTLNNNRNGVDAPLLGEADIMEFYSTWPEAYHALAHNWVPGGTSNGSPDNYCGRPNLTSQFNKYSATIEPGRISFYFNDQPCGSTYVKDPAKAWGFGPDVTRPNWMILNLANDTRSGAEVVAPTQAAQLLVDRVEVRALPSADPFAGSTYELGTQCGSMIATVPNTVTGTQVSMQNDTDAAGQRWTLTPTTDGYYQLRNAASGQPAAVQNAATWDYAIVRQAAAGDLAGAEVKPVAAADGTYQFTFRHSGKAMHVRDNSANWGAAVEQSTASAACGHKWQLRKV